MRVAVSGATGFIGRHVVAELRRRQVDVVAFSRQAGAATPASPVLEGVELVGLDLTRSSEGAFALLGRPDALIHLAWGGLPNYRSLHHFEQELPSQYRFLGQMVRDGLKSLVVTGTCFEYGMQSGALDEAMPARPNNPYGFAKDTLRQQLEYLRATHPFALAWARLFYMHGEGQAPNSLLPQLERAVARGDAVFNMSGGEQLRDYLPVTEIARHLATLAVHRVDAGVLNLCSGRPVSVRKFVESLLAERGWNIALNLGHYPYPDYEPLAFWGTRNRLDGLLRQAEAGA